MAEVNQAGQSPGPLICKGAEVTLAQLLIRALSALERNTGTRQMMDTRFAIFFQDSGPHLCRTFHSLLSGFMKQKVCAHQEVKH